MQVNSHLERTRNPDFILWTMGVYQAVLRSLLRVFRAVPLPPALTLPLPLNPTPPPASIHGDRARGFPEHLARGFDVRRTMATATGWRAPVSVATVSMRPLLSYLSSASCQLTQLCVGYATYTTTANPEIQSINNHYLHNTSWSRICLIDLLVFCHTKRKKTDGQTREDGSCDWNLPVSYTI